MIKDNSIFIFHILDSIENIESFTQGVTKDDFIRNKEKQSAVVRQIEIIGEAVKNIPQSFRVQHPEIEWIKIAGIRDVVIHKYFDVSLDIVWEIVRGDIPVLKSKLQKIIKFEKS